MKDFKINHSKPKSPRAAQENSVTWGWCSVMVFGRLMRENIWPVQIWLFYHVSRQLQNPFSSQTPAHSSAGSLALSVTAWTGGIQTIDFFSMWNTDVLKCLTKLTCRIYRSCHWPYLTDVCLKILRWVGVQTKMLPVWLTVFAWHAVFSCQLIKSSHSEIKFTPRSIYPLAHLNFRKRYDHAEVPMV